LNAAKAAVQKDGKKCKSWISSDTSDTFQLIERKRIAKAQSSTEYKRLRSEVQKMRRRDKQAELELLCDEVEDNAKKGNGRLVFQTVKKKLKKLTKPFQPRTVAINSSTGKRLTEPDQVCHRWKEYCEELYNDDEENRQIDVLEQNHHR